MTQNAYTGPCQQRCVAADTLLNLALQETAPARIMATLQGALCQLYSAYLLHLRELAENYSCAYASKISTIVGLVQELAARDVVPAESAEIEALVKDAKSWLSLCLSAYEQFLAGPTSLHSEPPVGGYREIELHQEGTRTTLSVQSIQGWLDALNEMFERHRMLMQEY